MKENTKPINPYWNRVLKAIGAKPKAAPAVPAIKEPAAEPSGPIATLPLSKLRPFRDHPYQVREDAELLALSDSIEQHGVLSPVLVRPLEGTNDYEIVSGHRRAKAAELAGLSEVPVIVTELSRDEAVIQMVDSNLHREHLLPSEKAFAYRMKLEAMKRTAGRPKKENTPQPAANYRSDDAAAETFGVSGDTVRRYVRLTELIPELLDCMDRGEMALSVGEALSYLGEDMQYAVLDAMDAEGCTPSYAQAVRMKNMFRDGTLTEAAVAELLSERKANQKERISFPLDDLQRFFPPQYTPEQIRQSILRMLEEKEEREKEHRSRSRGVER